jgi:YVTN family beta-propeller protein
MVATRDGRMIFVTNRRENTVSVFEVEPQRVVAKFPVPGGPDMPMLSPDGSRLWVSGRYGDTTTVLDAGTFRRLKTFRTQRSPHGVFLATI